MSLKLALEGIGLVGLGIFTILWHVIKLISCIMIAGLISLKLGLTSYFWWFGTIIIFTILTKIVFYGNNTSSYKELVDNYNEKIEE